jgi:hypothetical protein
MRLSYLLATALALTLLPSCGGCDDGLELVRASLVVEPGEAIITGVPVAQDTPITFSVPNRRSVGLTEVVATLDLEASDPAFSLVENTIDRVDPGFVGQLVVNVRPVVEGTITAVLIVDANELALPNHVEVPITVTAVDVGLPDIEVTPVDVVFDVIGRADVGREIVTIKNTGIRDLVIDDVSKPEAPFTLVGCPPAGTAISAGQSLECIVTFRPGDTEQHNSSFVIKSNDPNESEVTVTLSAQAIDCPTALAVRVDEGDIEPFDTVRLDGRGSSTTAAGTSIPPPPDGYEWQLVQRPVGSTTTLSSINNNITELPVDLAGFYQVQLTVFAVDDARPDAGLIRSCTPSIVDIDVVPEDDLHIQLVWDSPNTDFDLHVVRDGGSTFNHDDDVYFSNRLPERTDDTPSWSISPDENPRLDKDDSDGYGPENANLKHPALGSRWVVYVHYWNQRSVLESTTATLRVFVLGRQAIELRQLFEDDQQMWKALEIVWGDDPLAQPTLTQLGQLDPFPRPF